MLNIQTSYYRYGKNPQQNLVENNLKTSVISPYNRQFIITKKRFSPHFPNTFLYVFFSLVFQDGIRTNIFLYRSKLSELERILRIESGMAAILIFQFKSFIGGVFTINQSECSISGQISYSLFHRSHSLPTTPIVF